MLHGAIFSDKWLGLLIVLQVRCSINEDVFIILSNRYIIGHNCGGRLEESVSKVTIDQSMTGLAEVWTILPYANGKRLNILQRVKRA